MNDNKKIKAKTDKKRGKMRHSTQNKIAATIIIVVIVIACFCYFAYVTGLPAKVLTGAKLVEVVDGKETTLDRFEVTEMNYYYRSVLSSYSQQGYLSGVTDLEQKIDETSDQTYEDVLYEAAAEQLKYFYLLNEEADKAGFKPEATERVVELAIDDLRETADEEGLTADQYLASSFGTGMTVQKYREILTREYIAYEYEYYLQQTIFRPTIDDVQGLYDADPGSYRRANFNYYYFAADIPDEATDEEKAAAIAEAQQKADDMLANVTDGASFREEAMAIATETQLASFEDDADPTLAEGYAKTTVAYLSTDMAEYLFATERVTGDKSSFATDNGVYVVLFDSTTLDETLTASFRSIKLENKTYFEDGASLEEIQAGLAETHQQAEDIVSKATSETEYISLCKKYSSNTSGAIAGGLVTGQTAADYEATDELDIYAAQEAQISAWLFDEARVAGDTLIVDYDAYVMVYYFVDVVPGWMDSVRSDAASNAYSSWETTLVSNEAYKVIVNKGWIDFSTY